MAVDAQIKANGLIAGVAPMKGLHTDKHAIYTITDPLVVLTSDTIPFLNANFGIAMNQDASFGGTPTVIHNGGDSVAWTGSNIVGNKVNFASVVQAFEGTASVEINNASLNDIWEFDNGSAINPANHVAVTMEVYIDKDWSAGDSIKMYGWDSVAGMATEGVLLEDHINEFTFGEWQAMVVSLADLGLNGNEDGIRFEVAGIDGKGPRFFLDKMQLEETGNPIVYRATIPKNRRYHANGIRVTMTDDIAGTVTGGTMPGLAHDQFLGVTSLLNGILFQLVQDGEVTGSFNAQNLGQWLSQGVIITNAISDGTKTLMTAEIEFDGPIILQGIENSDFMEITIRDNLSGLTGFIIQALGSVET